MWDNSNSSNYSKGCINSSSFLWYIVTTEPIAVTTEPITLASCGASIAKGASIAVASYGASIAVANYGIAYRA